MEILELNLKHFGKFQEHTIKLHPGVNIIYGGNETGKSTIHAFIRAMLFGIERSRGKAGRRDEYQLRQPWENPACFSGSMRVRYEGRIYRIERNFYNKEKEVHLICETTGEELGMEDGELSGFLAGMSENAFRNTVFVPQAGCETDAGLALELQRFMVNFQETGDGNLDVARALDRLKEQKKKLESRKKQEQDLLDEKIARRQAEMDYVKRELEQKMTGSPEKQEEPEREREMATEKDPAHRQPEAGIGQSASEQEKERYRTEQTVSGKESQRRTCSPLLVWINILLFVCGGLGYACSIFAASFFLRLLTFLAGTIFLFLFGLILRHTLRTYCSFFQRRRNEQNELKKTRSKAENTWGNPEEERSGNAAEEELLQLAEKALKEGKRRWYREEKQKELREKEVQLDVIRREMEELYGEREKLVSYDREMEAVDLAMLRIRELSAKIYREAGSELNRTASEILAELTDGRYTQVALDEKMEVRINTPSRLLYLHQVSYGTMNQIYFALRMAAGALLSFGQPVPIVLDEAFAMYDQERLQAVLRWLDGCGRQVILFSCQTREKILLDRIRQEDDRKKKL